MIPWEHDLRLPFWCVDRGVEQAGVVVGFLTDDQWADRALTETDLASADAMREVASLLKQQQT